MEKWSLRLRIILSILMLFPSLALADLKIHFIDVGQGDSILVQCDGESLLVDAGPEGAGETVNGYLRSALNMDSIDYVIATHEHDDHLGGMLAALQGLTVGHIYSSPAISSSYWFQTVLPGLKQKGMDVSYPVYLDSFQLGGATVTFINPLNEAENANDRSLAVRIEYGENTALLMTDIEAEAESAMLSHSEVSLKADVLKVGHHGGNTSSTEAFIRVISPTIAVISVGADNKHGHPHAEPLRILQKVGAIIYRTDHYGNIVCSGDGTNWTVTVSRTR